MRKASSVTLGILKSLYPRADLDSTGEGFTTTCTKEEVEKLVEDFVEIVTRVIEMILVDTS
jgi:hypothetical protein